MTDTCMACSGTVVSYVRDGAYIKPVCAQHKDFYEREGYEVVDRFF